MPRPLRFLPLTCLLAGLLLASGCDAIGTQQGSGNDEGDDKITSRITSDTSLTGGTTHVVAGVVEVSDGATLTIESGATLEFQDGAGLKVEGDGSALVASGTASETITFTGTTEQAGFWNGIGINSANVNNELSHVTIEYAGGGGLYTFINGTAALQLKKGSAVTISNSTIRNNANYGLSAQANVDLSGFSGNTFKSNGATSMNVYAANMGSLDAGTSYGSYVHVNNGSISGETQTIAAIGVPYRVAGVRAIDSGSDVTVKEGATFAFESGAGLKIDGSSTVFKTEDNSSTDVTFTGTTEQKGFWKGIGFSSGNTNNELSDVVVEYAGGGNIYTFTDAANIQLSSGAKLTLTNSIIQDSGSYGLASSDGASAVTESGNTYRDNADGARNF